MQVKSKIFFVYTTDHKKVKSQNKYYIYKFWFMLFILGFISDPPEESQFHDTHCGP